MLLLLIFAMMVGGPTAAWFIMRSVQQRQGAATGRQKSSRESTNAMRLPYRYADDLIFISGDSVWTGVKLAPTTDEYLTYEEQADAAAAVANTYNALINVFDGEPVHCHEQIRYRPSSADEWEGQYLKALWNPSSLFRSLIQHVSGLLSASAPERCRFLMVRLGDFEGDSVPDPLNAIATAVSGVADEHFQRADLDPFRERAIRVHMELAAFGATPMTRGDLIWLIKKVLSGHRFPEEQPILASKPVRNSYFDMVGNFHGRNGHDYVEVIDSDPETGEPRSSFTTTLVVAHTAPVAQFNPATAWGPALSQHVLPVELSWRYELIPASHFKRRALKVADNIRDEANDRAAAGATDDAFFDSKHERAEQLRDEISVDPQPAMIGRLRLVLSAPSPHELAAAERDVRTTLGDVEMVRVPRAQYLLLQEQLPGDYTGSVFGGLVASTGAGLAIGERYSDIWAPAVARLDSDPRVGDRVEMHKGNPRGWSGFPIGWTSANGAPMHFGLHVQVARDRGCGVAIVGASGGGKSTLALLIFFWESESGTQCMALDPKNDFEKFCYYLAFGDAVVHPDFAKEAEAGTLGREGSQFQPVNREFWEDTTIINLTKGVAGQLDAWGIYESYAEAEELARGQVEALFRDLDDRAIVEQGLVAMRDHWEQQSAGTLPAGVKPVTPSLGAVVSFIEGQRSSYEEIPEERRDIAWRKEVERINRVLDRFRRAATTQYAKLMIGNGERVGLGDLTRRRVIFTLHGFTSPAKPNQPELWTEGERNAAACMYTALTLVHGMFDDTMRRHPVTGRLRVPPRALFVDEGYMIAAQPKGQELLSRGLRQGRSLNLIIVFISQQPRDIQLLEEQAKAAGEADVNQFGTVFVFRQKSPAEAFKALQLLRDTTGDATNEVMALARRLREEGPAGGVLRGGRCAMRDVDGRVATVSIDQMFAELGRATETNATERPLVQSTPIPADGRDWELDFTTMVEVRTGILEATQDHGGYDGEVEFDQAWQEYLGVNPDEENSDFEAVR